MSKAAKLETARIISNCIYGIGVTIVLALCGIFLFGSNQPVNPDAMLPFSWKELAFIWLAFGTIPMLLACVAVYNFNAIKNSPGRKLHFALVFLPGFICGACALYIAGMVIYGLIDYYLLR
ncbi:MAG TPA: hypothetical protein PLP87_10275 [Clostridiales bacterium]|mgnify:CR=1 FL=1|nr:hypothetical protein [Clostridiales bacterium]